MRFLLSGLALFLFASPAFAQSKRTAPKMFSPAMVVIGAGLSVAGTVDMAIAVDVLDSRKRVCNTTCTETALAQEVINIGGIAASLGGMAIMSGIALMILGSIKVSPQNVGVTPGGLIARF